LLAGVLRLCLHSASSAEASLHAALAARRGIIVRCRFRMADRAVRAAEFRIPMPQFFAVAASVPIGLARHAQRIGFALRLAADPLRLSAEGAEPDPVTSDALCHRAALTQKAPSPSRSLVPAKPAFRRAP